jgi:hypothetical protein
MWWQSCGCVKCEEGAIGRHTHCFSEQNVSQKEKQKEKPEKLMKFLVTTAQLVFLPTLSRKQNN